MATKIEICTTSLLMVGADEITSFEDETREAKLCANLYPTIRDDLLQSHVWRFSVGQASLNRLVSAPLFGYSYAFQLPANHLRLVGKNNSALKHEILEDKLYCNALEVLINYQFTPSEVRYPAYFVKALELEMAAILAVALIEDEGKSSLFERKAKAQLVKARYVDSQNNGNHAMPEHNFALTAIRH